MQFEFSDDFFCLPIYHLLVSLLRQDCIMVWVLLVCLELWTKSEEPPGFVICALLLGTTVTLFHMIPGNDTGRALSNLLKYVWLFSPLKRKNVLIFNF